jgi:hypothetical protein
VLPEGRSSAESFPHFYIFLFAFLIIFPIRFVPLCLCRFASSSHRASGIHFPIITYQLSFIIGINLLTFL